MARDDEAEVTTMTPSTTETTSTETTSAPVTDAPTEASGNVASATQPAEQPAEGSAAPATPVEAAPAGPTDEEIATLFTAFEEATKAAVEGADPATVEMSADLVNAVLAAFQALPAGATRTKAKRLVNDEMKANLTKGQLVPARAYLTLESTLAATSSRRETVATPKVDPTTAFAEHIAALLLSPNLAEVPGDVVIDGEGNWRDKAQALATSLKGETGTYATYLRAHATWSTADEATRGEEPQEPTVNQVVVRAARIANGRPSGVRKARAASATSDGTPSAPRAPRAGGPRGDVKAHIAEVFAAQPSGTFLKFGEISKATSSGYPEAGTCSQGAISSAAKSARFNLEGLSVATQGGVQGIRKA